LWEFNIIVKRATPQPQSVHFLFQLVHTFIESCIVWYDNLYEKM